MNSARSPLRWHDAQEERQQTAVLDVHSHHRPPCLRENGTCDFPFCSALRSQALIDCRVMAHGMTGLPGPAGNLGDGDPGTHYAVVRPHPGQRLSLHPPAFLLGPFMPQKDPSAIITGSPFANKVNLFSSSRFVRGSGQGTRSSCWRLRCTDEDFTAPNQSSSTCRMTPVYARLLLPLRPLL